MSQAAPQRDPIDQIMEEASDLLIRMRYAQCEALCLKAMAMARRTGDFDQLGRIIMPLQEARRWRRQCATDAGVIVITQPMPPAEILRNHPAGCLLLTGESFSEADEKEIRNIALEQGLDVEVMRLGHDALRALFLREFEARGDQRLHEITSGKLSGQAKIDALIALLDGIGDHEIAHQTLSQEARQVAQSLARSAKA